ncbi:6128_t:CDS:2, partial [Cetraspora pellucida]
IEEKNYRAKYFEPFGKESERSSFAEDDGIACRKVRYLSMKGVSSIRQ